MKLRSFKNLFLLVLFIGYIFLYKFIVFPKYMMYSEVITASFMILFFGIALKLLGYRKYKGTVLSKNVIQILIFYLILVFFVMYGLGIIVGFLKNAYSRTLFSLFDNMFSPIIIIIFSELLRYVFVSANKDKKFSIILFTILLMVFEACISVRVIDFSDLSSLFNITATLILPIIFKNILLTYLTYNVGYKSTLLYRLVMDTYIFFVPIVPNLGDYVNSMVFISLPILIYISIFAMVDDRITKPEPIFNKKNFTMLDIPVTVILVVLIALISGFFPLYMIGIGSESMSPVIHKGDAVILKNQMLKKGDIIAYSSGKLIIVHRIKEVKEENGKVLYVMKGDANASTDPRDVYQTQVKGIVKFKIPVRAWPTVWLTELFNS